MVLVAMATMSSSYTLSNRPSLPATMISPSWSSIWGWGITSWNQPQRIREHIPGVGTNCRGSESIFQGWEPPHLCVGCIKPFKPLFSERTTGEFNVPPIFRGHRTPYGGECQQVQGAPP
eukprot:460333-Pyramimonas_sp.AAC.2